MNELHVFSESCRGEISISMDICSVRTRSPMDSFLTIVDVFSRYSVFIPVNKDATAEIILDKFMQHWIRYFGFPASVTVDRGSNFTNKLLGRKSQYKNM